MLSPLTPRSLCKTNRITLKVCSPLSRLKTHRVAAVAAAHLSAVLRAARALLCRALGSGFLHRGLGVMINPPGLSCSLCGHRGLLGVDRQRS